MHPYHMPRTHDDQSVGRAFDCETALADLTQAHAGRSSDPKR